MRVLQSIFVISSMVLLALCFPIQHGRLHGEPDRNACNVITGEIIVNPIGENFDLATVFDATDFQCNDPIIISSPITANFAGVTLIVDGPHPGVFVGTVRSFDLQAIGIKNLNIVFTKEASDGLECWNNDCSQAVFGTESAVRNNGISVHHAHWCTIENVTVKGGPSGGIIFADSQRCEVTNVDVSDAKWDGIGCNATWGINFHNVRSHHNGHAGVTLDIDGSCAFYNLASYENGQHGVYARNTKNPITFVGGSVWGNGDTAFFLDRSEPGNPETCVKDFRVERMDVRAKNVAFWEDPDCHKTTNLKISASFAADPGICAQAALVSMSDGVRLACGMTPPFMVALKQSGS